MTGRGIDQIQPHPSDPRLHEAYVRDARAYVELAERVSGPIPRSVPPAYVWGEALEVLDAASPDARIVNLETSVTTSDAAWPGKGIHYRMHPANVACLTAAGLDCCVLANNHVLDFGYDGLIETLASLRNSGIGSAGAGVSAAEAAAPCDIALAGKVRVRVLGFGCETSGIPRAWAAARNRPGIHLLEYSPSAAARIAEKAACRRAPGDLIVASIHWGGNWGYEIPFEHRELAHALIDARAADIVHGHSSHHAKGIEVYRGRPILYGCGDFLTDYEGISGYERYRGDLAALYFVDIDAVRGELVGLELVAFRVERFSLRRAPRMDVSWLQAMFDRECRQFGARTELAPEHHLVLRWE